MVDEVDEVQQNASVEEESADPIVSLLLRASEKW